VILRLLGKASNTRFSLHIKTGCNLPIFITTYHYQSPTPSYITENTFLELVRTVKTDHFASNLGMYAKLIEKQEAAGAVVLKGPAYKQVR